MKFAMWAILALGLFLSSCATAQSGAMIRAREGIAKGKYEWALQRLTEAQGYKAPGPNLSAEIAYLKGYCLEALGRLDEAIAMYEYTSDQFPDTEHGYLARQKLARLNQTKNRV